MQNKMRERESKCSMHIFHFVSSFFVVVSFLKIKKKIQALFQKSKGI